MATTCSDLDRWLAAAGEAAGDADWERHLALCASCRAQWSAHRALVSALGAEPVPELDPRLNRSLRARLERAAEPARLPERSWPARWGLRLYWLATALLSAAIVARIDWPRALESRPWLLLLLLSPLLASPLLLLLDFGELARLTSPGATGGGREPGQLDF